jgi:2-keto-4-pentenoate hydratase
MGEGGEGGQREGRVLSRRDELSVALVVARRGHRALASGPWADVLVDSNDAYAVQDDVAGAFNWFADGAVRHWKSGGPSRDVALTHAPLPPAGVFVSPADLTTMRLHARAIEPEIALRLGVDVTPRHAAALTHDEVDALIDAMAVSIEVVDSRWSEGAQAPSLLRLADLQSHAALVLGAWQPYVRRVWRTQRCVLQVGDAPPTERIGTHSLRDPAWVLPQWLRHATRHGATLPAGTVVTTGTWAGVVPVLPGEQVQVSFDGVGEASVRL